MRNKIRYIRLIGLIFVLIVGSSLTFAQNKSKRKSAKKPLVYDGRMASCASWAPLVLVL